jgi:hypothetical protein
VLSLLAGEAWAAWLWLGGFGKVGVAGGGTVDVVVGGGAAGALVVLVGVALLRR